MKFFRYLLLILACLGVILVWALPQSTSKTAPAIEQGISGHILFWKGDFMPGVGEEGGAKVQPVERILYIYEATKESDVTQPEGVYAPFYGQINTKLITEVTSNKQGFFQVALEPGTYSLFVKEDKLQPAVYYANLTDGDGTIYPVTVKAGEVTEIEFDITYQSVH